MIILPAEFSFLKGAEGSFGYIDNYNTSAPELVLDTEKVRTVVHAVDGVTCSQGEIRFQGRFQEMSTLFMAIDLQPRKNQSLCQDITSRALVFDMVSFIRTIICGDCCDCNDRDIKLYRLVHQSGHLMLI